MRTGGKGQGQESYIRSINASTLCHDHASDGGHASITCQSACVGHHRMQSPVVRCHSPGARGSRGVRGRQRGGGGAGGDGAGVECELTEGGGGEGGRDQHHPRRTAALHCNDTDADTGIASVDAHRCGVIDCHRRVSAVALGAVTPDTAAPLTPPSADASNCTRGQGTPASCCVATPRSAATRAATSRARLLRSLTSHWSSCVGMVASTAAGSNSGGSRTTSGGTQGRAPSKMKCHVSEPAPWGTSSAKRSAYLRVKGTARWVRGRWSASHAAACRTTHIWWSAPHCGFLMPSNPSSTSALIRGLRKGSHTRLPGPMASCRQRWLSGAGEMLWRGAHAAGHEAQGCNDAFLSS